MSEEKWDKLPFILKTSSGDRSLMLLSNFEPTKDGWFDTGLYTVAEQGVTLGDISVDLYTDGGISWDGKPDEFSEEELDAIVDHIAFRDLPELENLVDNWEQPEPSGDYRLYDDMQADGSTLLVIKNKDNDQTLMVKVTPNFEGFTIDIDGKQVAIVIKRNEGWEANTEIPDDLLNFIIDHLEDQGRL